MAKLLNQDVGGFQVEVPVPRQIWIFFIVTFCYIISEWMENGFFS